MAINFPDSPTEGQVFKPAQYIQSNFIYRSGMWTRAEGWVLIQNRGAMSGAVSYVWTLPLQYKEFKLHVYGFTPADGVTGVSYVQVSYDPSGSPIQSNGTAFGGYYSYSGGQGAYVSGGDNGLIQVGGGQDGAQAFYAGSYLQIDIWPGEASQSLPTIRWFNSHKHSSDGYPQYLVGGGYHGAVGKIQAIWLHMNGPQCRAAGANLWGLL